MENNSQKVIDLILKIAKLRWGSSLIKLGSTIAVIGVVAVTSILQQIVVQIFAVFGYAIKIPDTPIWLGLVLVTIGVGTATLGAYWQRTAFATKPNPHDVELLLRVREQITEELTNFLRHHDFGISFYDRVLGGMYEVANWKGGRFEFIDEKVQVAFKDVQRLSDDLGRVIAQKTYPLERNSEKQTVHRCGSGDWDIPDDVREAITELNTISTDLVEAVDNFERISRNRIPFEAAGKLSSGR